MTVQEVMKVIVSAKEVRLGWVMYHPGFRECLTIKEITQFKRGVLVGLLFKTVEPNLPIYIDPDCRVSIVGLPAPDRDVVTIVTHRFAS